MKYREDQKKIMDYTDGRIAVPAVPGAGKTFVLTHLSAKLLSQNSEKKILILTFMNSAVGNFKTRISKLLANMDLDAGNRFEVMTIHSLAMKIVQYSPQTVNLDENFNVIDEVQRNYFIRQCVEDWRYKNRDEFEFFIEPKNIGKEYRGERYEEKWEKDVCSIFKSVITELKNKAVTDEEIIKLKEKVEKKTLMSVLIDVYREYNKKMKRAGLIDFDDILIMALEILKKDKTANEYFSQKYDFIFEDEAQDSNIVQGEILKIISDKNGNLVKVGDVNQSILSTFTASDPKLFKRFCEITEKAELFSAGRSSRDIIAIANYFMDMVMEKNPVEATRNALEKQHINPVKEGEHPKNPVSEKYGVTYRKSLKWEDEIDYLVDYTKKIHKKFKDENEGKKKDELKNIAVLVPDNYTMTEIAQRFEDEKIDYEELSDMSKEKIKCVRLLGKIIEFAGEQSNDDKFFSAIKEVTQIKNSESEKKIKEYIEEKGCIEILFPRGGNRGEYFPENLCEEEEKILLEDGCRKLKKVCEFPKNSYEELVLYISDILHFDGSEKAIAQNVASSVNTLFMLNPKWTLADLGRELEESKNNRFSFFSKLVYDAYGYEPSREKVTIATYHKSKGMEWDCVFLIGVTSDNFQAKLTDNFKGEYYYLKKEYSSPAALAKAELEALTGEVIMGENPVIVAKIENISERARLLYVGITRAKEYLILTASKEKGKKKYETYYFDMLGEYIESKRVNG